MKTVLISGGAVGIGGEIAREFASKNYKVAINYKKSSSKAVELVDKIVADGGSCDAFYADISNYNDIEKMKNEINETFGDIDILVNNAGISSQKLFTNIKESEWDDIFSVNVKGTYLLSKAFLPSMINKKFGRIINISSILGISGASCEVHYCASKASIIGFTRALAKEVGLSGITVNAIAPGFIDTPMNEDIDKEAVERIINKTAIGRIGYPKDIAPSVAFLASDEASFITGQVLSIDGGLFSI